MGKRNTSSCIAALAMTIVILALPTKVYAGWGIGMDASYWKMDADDFKTDMKYNTGDPYYAGKITQGTINPDVNFFYEYPLKEDWLLGTSLGFGKVASVKYAVAYIDTTEPDNSFTAVLENKASVIPLEIYGKYKKEKLNITGGLGLNYFIMKTEMSGADSSGLIKGDFKKNKIVPNISVGGEYFIGENFSLGLNLKYLFSGRIEDFRGNITGVTEKQRLVMIYDPPYGRYLTSQGVSTPLSAGDMLFGYDMSGLRINLAARYYFGGK